MPSPGTTSSASRTPSVPRLIVHVSMIGFATALSARAVDPLVPTMAHDLAVEPGKVALLSTAFALPFAFVQPVLGALADVIGKVRTMVICLIVIIAMSALCALARDFELLLAARIVCGMATGGIFPVGMALIADLVPVADRQVAIARWLSILIGGNLIGAAFAGVVGDLFGWRTVFATIAACGVAALLNARINLRGTAAAAPATGRFNLRSIPSAYAAIFANPRAKFCFSAVFFEGMAVFGVFPFIALLLHAAGEPRASIAGLVLAGFSVGGIIYSLSVGSLMRWQSTALMVGGGLAAAFAYAIIALDPPWPVQFLALGGLGIGFYCLHGCIQVEATELSSTARGAAMSLHSFSFFWDRLPVPCSTEWASPSSVRARPCCSVAG
jgi:predicted MFS family arabinose efflux permease